MSSEVGWRVIGGAADPTMGRVTHIERGAEEF